MKKKTNRIKERWKSVPKRIKWPVFLLGFIFIVAFIGYGVMVYGGGLIVDDEDLLLDTTTTIETQNGDVLASLYNENREIIKSDDVPDHVKNAFVAIEDRRFYHHSGIDYKSGIRAIFKDVLAMGKVEGASTITQQLAKNLFLTNDKTWLRKTKEVMASIYLERHFSKNDILELYMNQMYFGQGVYGIEKASQLFFSKSASELTVTEGAMLAGMAKAPNGYSPIDHPDRALERRDTVLQAMNDAGMISTENRVENQGKTLGLDVKEEQSDHVADSYVDLVMKEAAEDHQLSMKELKRGGYRIVVNMDETIQQIAYDQFQDADYFPGNTEGTEGAFVMMDQENGGIVAAIGGRDYQLGEWNRAAVKRNPGSTMKPIAVYGPAMMQKTYDPYSLILDQKKDYDGYTASNIDDQYEGTVSLYKALVESKNAPAVWLLDNLGITEAKNYLEKMGITLPDNGLSIALGGLKDGLTPVDMMQSYGTFANGGDMMPARTIDRIYKSDGEPMYQAESSSKQVFSEQVAWNMTEMLSSVVEDGTAQAGDYSKALAGKTGTTRHPEAEGYVKDAWFVGYTPQYVSSLWMGYDKADAEHYLTGGSEYPTKLTKAILTEMDSRSSLQESFKKPEEVDSLPKPIEMPEKTEVSMDYTFGGLSVVKGKMMWNAADDDRVEYHVYRKTGAELPEKIGTAKKNEFTVNDISVFSTSDVYYVVPYDPLTKTEGNQSNKVELSS